MTITSISQDLNHIQGAFHQGRIAALSEPQKEVWKQFLNENETAADLEDKDRTPGFTFFPQSSVVNLFSFNMCGCNSLAGITNLKSVENSSAGEELRYGLNGELIADPSLLHDSDGQNGGLIADSTERLLSDGQNAELIADPTGMLDSDGQGGELAADSVLMPDNGGAIDEEMPKIGLDGAVETENISETSFEKIVHYASKLLGESSPMTSEWLNEHIGVTKLISTFPEFASYLNDNSDLALNFMKSLEEVKSTLADFFNKNTLEEASELLSDDSPITDEWLAENINAAHFIVANPRFAAYLQENIEQAEKFISLSA